MEKRKVLTEHKAQAVEGSEVTAEELREAHVPTAWRDNCSAILIKLNECRHENYYRMDKCKELRHEYEKCQHEEYAVR